MPRWRQPSLWLRYVLSLSAAENPAAEVQANPESQIIVAQDQAPHAKTIGRGARPELALVHAIARDVRGRIRHQEPTGPLQSVRCVHADRRHGARQALRRTALAGNVSYPFLGVVDSRAGTATWCKRDPPPTPALGVAVSHRCRA